MKLLLPIIIVLLLLSSCSAAGDCSEQDTACTRVLFVGNSYIYVNDLPNTFAQLAKSGKHKVEVGMSAQGGWELSQHAQSADTLSMIASKKWKYVVLQEQSQIPSIAQFRTNSMYPAARILAEHIRANGATPMFFLTWAHREGWPENGLDFNSMQYQLNNGYYGIAQELNAPVAPVGGAWFTAITQHPELELWQDDGSHPSEQGTYLAACVFYAVIFQESPVGLNYHANLSDETAEILQTVGATALPTPH